MAVLSLDTLSGCSSIPSFLGGTSDTPSNPTKSIFYNTNAPTNWVKDTTHNDKALRVIGGANGVALSPGGTAPFNGTLVSGFSFTVTSTAVTPGTSGLSTSNYSTVSTTATTTTQPATLSSVQIAPHVHQYWYTQPTAPTFQFSPGTSPLNAAQSIAATSGANATNPATHSHTYQTPHTHQVFESGHGHPITVTTHSHSAPISQNYNILYIDVIIATKS